MYIDGAYTDPCPGCGKDSEVVSIKGLMVACNCPRCGWTHERSVMPHVAELVTEWLELNKRWPRESFVTIWDKGVKSVVEVIGHKAQSIRTGHPALRVLKPNGNTELFGYHEIAQWNKEDNHAQS